MKLNPHFYLAAGLLALAAVAAPMHLRAQAGTIKVGVLHSLSGTMAISETTLKDTVLMLIDEQNKKGGLLGRKLEAVVVDPASDWPLFAEKANQLLVKDKVSVVFGCWTSVSRRNGRCWYPHPPAHPHRRTRCARSWYGDRRRSRQREDPARMPGLRHSTPVTQAPRPAPRAARPGRPHRQHVSDPSHLERASAQSNSSPSGGRTLATPPARARVA